MSFFDLKYLSYSSRTFIISADSSFDFLHLEDIGNGGGLFVLLYLYVSFLAEFDPFVDAGLSIIIFVIITGGLIESDSILKDSAKYTELFRELTEHVSFMLSPNSTPLGTFPKDTENRGLVVHYPNKLFQLAFPQRIS